MLGLAQVFEAALAPSLSRHDTGLGLRVNGLFDVIRSELDHSNRKDLPPFPQRPGRTAEAVLDCEPLPATINSLTPGSGYVRARDERTVGGVSH